MRFWQKESLGEYGSGWGWDSKMPHVFDQTNAYITVKNEKTGVGELVSDDTPMRYTDNGTKLGYCFDDVERTNGQILDSGSFMSAQKSCRPDAGNAGNYYNWVSLVAMGNADREGYNLDSICPKGWQSFIYDGTNRRSIIYAVQKAYGITESNSSSRFRDLPWSFVFGGGIDGEKINRNGSSGSYLYGKKYSNNQSYRLEFSVGSLYMGVIRNTSASGSLRCVCNLGGGVFSNNRGGELSKRARSFRKISKK